MQTMEQMCGALLLAAEVVSVVICKMRNLAMKHKE